MVSGVVLPTMSTYSINKHSFSGVYPKADVILLLVMEMVPELFVMLAPVLTPPSIDPVAVGSV